MHLRTKELVHGASSTICYGLGLWLMADIVGYVDVRNFLIETEPHP